MKYVVMRVKVASDQYREMPFIFPNMCVHSEIADSIKENLALVHQWLDVETVAAGEVSLFTANIQCGGHSSTLDLKSRGEQDELLIRMMDYTHGYIA